MTKYPLLRPAIAMASGIFLASFVSIDWRTGFVGAGMFAAAGLLFKENRTLLGIAFWFFLGASLLAFRFDTRAPNDLRRIVGDQPELVTIVGALSDDPERRVLEQDRRTRYRTTARVSVHKIRRGEAAVDACGDVAVTTLGFVPEDFVAGTRVEINGVLSRPRGPLAPGLFDFEQYLKWQRVFFVLRAETTNDWTMVQPSKGWSLAALYRGFDHWARQTLQRGIPADENTRLLWAMTLGWRAGLTNEISEPFQRTGTLHVFAISGLHIAMIATFLVGFQRALWFPDFFVNAWIKVFPEINVGLSRTAAGAVTIPAIWFYTAATGMQASAVRSTIMCSIIILGWMMRRPNNLLNSLAASAVVIFLWQPEQLFQAGFQLSFILLLSIALWPGLTRPPWPDPTVVLGQADIQEFAPKEEINMWTRGLAFLYERLTGRDPLLPADLRPQWRKALDGPIEWLLGGANLSIAALLGSLPVIANYFNLVSFSSVVANLVIVPVSGLALGSSMASLLFFWVPFASELLNWASWGAMGFMVWFCRILESVSWTYEYVKSPGWTVIVAYYIGFIAIIHGRFRLFFASIAIVIAFPLWNEARTTTVTLLPGSGVVFVDAPWWKNDVLIDCGRDQEVATIVKPFLRSRGVDRLQAVVLTHGDVEHVEGYPRLAEEFKPSIIYTSAARSRSPKYRGILRALDPTPDRHRVVAAGDAIAGWKVLHPERGVDFSRADDEAIVLSGQVGGVKLTCLSDLGRLGQQSLASSSASPKSDVVLSGVPADGQALRPELVALLDPRVVALAGGDALTRRALRELRPRLTNLVTTLDERAITVTARGRKVFLETMSGRRVELR